MAEKVLKGGDKLAKKLAELSNKINESKIVKVGFLEGAKYPDGTPTAMIAAIQEFGAPAKGIPPRPFFRSMINKEEGHWGDDLGEILKHENYDVTKSLNQMGSMIAGELRQSIADLTEPELSPVTLLLRQRFGNNPGAITFADVMQARRDIASGTVPNVTPTQGKPLVWTGHLLQTVDAENAEIKPWIVE